MKHAETLSAPELLRRSRPLRLRGPVPRAWLWLLARELQGLRGSHRLSAVASLVVMLMVFSALIHALRYRADAELYRETIESYSESLAGVSVSDFAELRHPAAKPPWRLAFLADGEQSNTPDLYRQGLSAWVEPQLGFQGGIDGGVGETWARDAEALDWLFVVRVVLSLAAFLLGYDAVCGAHQRSLLQLLASYPVADRQVLLAKALAVWGCLAVPFVVGAAASVGILTGLGGLFLTVAELLRVAQVLFVGLWASAFFVGVALLVSVLARDPARSLSVLALIWVTGVVALPAAGALLARTLEPLPTEREVGRRMDEIRREVEAVRGGAGSWRPPAWARADGYALERQAAATQNRRFERQEALRRQLIREQLAQAALARRLASLSPATLVQDLSERLLGTGQARDRAFLKQAWTYREELARHLRRLDGADPESPHVFFFAGYLSTRAVDAAAVPRFRFREVSVIEGLRAAGPTAATLLLLSLLLAAAVVLGYARTEKSWSR